MDYKKINYAAYLTAWAKENDIYIFVAPVLEDKYFSEWTGSGDPNHHHYGDGGLIAHTNEVVEFCKLIACQHNNTCVATKRMNVAELFISAVWHDYGKIWDYQKVDDVWKKSNNHAREIHHISRSAMEFSKHYKNVDNSIKIKYGYSVGEDNVIHNILSHHGRREWGSPVSPHTREAWTLHLADNLSAQLDACEKFELP